MCIGLPGTAFAHSTPNVILILADDMGYSDLGCYGSEIATPNLDRLAAQGTRFTQFYNASKCEPTRACLMSGQYWQDTGFGVKRGPTMGEVMKLGGYATFAIGKWHLNGNPVDRGFDRYFGHLSGGSHYFYCNNSQRLDDKPFKEKSGEEFYMTDANADYATEFLKQHQANRDETPFFMYMAFNAPHSPMHALPEDIAKYRDAYHIGWDNIRQRRYDRQIELGITKKEWGLTPRDQNIPAWDSLSQREKNFEATRMAIYAAMVDRMDQAIGRVLDQVKAMGEERNTLVVFLSDNGGSASDPSTAPRTPAALLAENGAGLDGYWVGLGWSNASNTPFQRYKCGMGNGGIATSCIASWPDVIKQPGGICDERSHIIDLMATIADVGKVDREAAFGKQLAAKLPGKSLMPLLKGEPREAHDALYFHLFRNRAIVAGDYKLVTDWESPWKLFSTTADRTELHDLSAEQPELAAKLRKQWEDWYANVREKRFTDGSGFPRYRRIDDPEETFLRKSDEDDSWSVVGRSEIRKPRKKRAQ